MFRFDQRLIQIFLEARNQAIETRNINGVSTIDLFIELIEDSESVLYSYLSEMNPEEEISAQLQELSEEFKDKEDVQYTISLSLGLINLSNDEKENIETLVTKQLYTYFLGASELAKSMQRELIIPEDVATSIIQNPIKPIMTQKK